MPEKLRVDADTKAPDVNPVEVIRQAGEHFKTLAGLKSDVIRTISTIMGVEGAEEIASLPALFKALGVSNGAAKALAAVQPGEAAEPAASSEGAHATATGDKTPLTGAAILETVVPLIATAAGGATESAVVTVGFGSVLATGAVALAAAGLIYIGINMVIRSHDSDKSDFARRVLADIRDAHFAHYMEHFDEVMETTRDYFESRLQTHYNLAPDMLRWDKAMRALGELKALRSEMHDAMTPLTLVYTA